MLKSFKIFNEQKYDDNVFFYNNEYVRNKINIYGLTEELKHDLFIESFKVQDDCNMSFCYTTLGYNLRTVRTKLHWLLYKNRVINNYISNYLTHSEEEEGNKNE